MLAEGEATIWTWLEKLGYDRDLYSLRSRIFTVTFHSRCLDGEEPIEVRVRDAVGLDLDNKASEMILATYGQEEAAGEGYKVISLFSGATNSFSYGVKNESGAGLEVTLDLSASENLLTSSKSPLVKKNLKTAEMSFMMHAQAGIGQFEKVLKHSGKSNGKK